jgi:hypothetical protein
MHYLPHAVLELVQHEVGAWQRHALVAAAFARVLWLLKLQITEMRPHQGGCQCHFDLRGLSLLLVHHCGLAELERP